MSGKLRCFLAHPRGCEDAEINLLRETAQALLKAQIAAHGGTVVPEVVAGRDDFNDRVMACGGWNDWAASVVDGAGYVDGALRTLYDLIIVSPTPLVGKATADMVTRALTNPVAGRRKPVFFMPSPDADDGNRLYPVTGLTLRDPENYKKSHALNFLQPI